MQQDSGSFSDSEHVEPILRPSSERYIVYPIKFPDIWAMYQKAKQSFWTPEEITLTRDVDHWSRQLSDDERHTIKMVLAFFSSSDGIVMENLAVRFMHDVQIPEARSFYAIQTAMETIHAETYSKLLLALVANEEERIHLFKSMDTIPVIRDKARWAMRWIEGTDCDFDTRLIAFAAVEGIFFSSSFAVVYWVKQRGLMPGFTFSNELIARDEGLHTEFACLLHRHIESPIPQSVITAIICEAVVIEQAFARESIPVPLLGLNSALMGQYIEYVADKLLAMLLCAPLYGTPNPFAFMNMAVLPGKTNFFERQVSEYAQPVESGSGDLEKSIFLTPDF